MRRLAAYNVFGLLIVVYVSCKKPFNPGLNTVVTNFLAVDGAIVSGDSTFITLSRTTKLTDTTQNKAELKAVVSVEDDQAKLYPLIEKGKGKYVLGVTNLSTARKYRLDIKTTDGKIYQSDFVPMKVTPPIDSVYFKQTGENNVAFYVDTHDATNNTRYYRWDYKETWSVFPFYQSYLQYKNAAVVSVASGSADDLTVCYRSGPSNQIFISSSAKLAEDAITAQQLSSLATGSEKIGHIYCMQLHQYALTEAGFKYYQNLKSNTEQLGSIFDAQPSSLDGNIHCITSPTDEVVGFISVSTIANKQYNLHYNDIPLRANNFYSFIYFANNNIVFGGSPISTNYAPSPTINDCAYSGSGSPQPYSTWILPVDPAATFNQRATRTLGKGDSLLINPYFAFGQLIGYYYAPKQCVDCRFKGGTNIRPAYFPPF